MTTRVYRYDKPAAEVLLDILNFTNKTAFEPRQLQFDELTRTDDYLGTRVTVKPKEGIRWTRSHNLFYDRLPMDEVFRCAPLVVDVDEVSEHAILTALHVQQGVFFDADQIELIAEPQSLAIAFPVTALEGFSTPTSEPDIEVPPYGEMVSFDYRIKAKDNSLLWVGQTQVLVRPVGYLLDKPVSQRLDVLSWFNETRQNKAPVERVIPRHLDATAHASALRQYKAGQHIDLTSTFPGIARSLTDDEWVASPEVEDFNLYQAKVLYNGYNSDIYFNGFARMSRVLALELSNKCRNLAGIWLLGYSDKDVYKYSPFTVTGETGLLLDL
ncbi:hypothetical protein ACLPJK_25790 [Pseudomonas aeruginosa]|uniref:DUF7941 domain-family protein n=1 Tax=Pseudomonas aeruginosa TaxID=287 RepID=UPI003D2CC1BF